MKKSVLLLLLFACHLTLAFGQHKEGELQKKKIVKPPFEGKRHFCSAESNMTYDVEIKGNKVVISYEKIKIKGIFKNGLLFTNDPQEIEYRRIAGQTNYGKYYVIGTDYFSVLNPENSEYFYYHRSKK
ncbi:MAG: hypothetical protein ACTHK8_03450 [Ginsengibacter sp.]